MTSVSALVVTWNSEATIRRCLSSLRGLDRPLEEILVLDNASSDTTPQALLDELPSHALELQRANNGFAVGMNTLARRAKGELLLLVNPDAYLHRDALGALLRTENEHRGAVVGGAIIGTDGHCQKAAARPQSPWWSIVRWLLGGRPFEWAVPAEQERVEAVSGAFMLVRYELWQQLGGFDEGFRHSGEDLDLCWRACNLGAEILFEPRAVAEHELEASVRQAPPEIEVLRWDGVVRLAAKREGRAAAFAIRGALALRTGAGLSLDRLRLVSRGSRDRRRGAALFQWALRPRSASVELPNAPVSR